MDQQGRIVVPKAARQKLGVDGEQVTVECEVRIDE
jgi:bifunctional DNA-binding transcriptional regulator/antitoxin component of YhaV-PrlF toxin-antitoxin module